MTSKILYQIGMENASAADLQDDLDELLALAKNLNVATPLFAAHGKRSDMESDDVEDLANDFRNAGYPVDFDDGPFITIREPGAKAPMNHPELTPTPPPWIIDDETDDNGGWIIRTEEEQPDFDGHIATVHFLRDDADLIILAHPMREAIRSTLAYIQANEGDDGFGPDDHAEEWVRQVRHLAAALGLNADASEFRLVPITPDIRKAAANAGVSPAEFIDQAVHLGVEGNLQGQPTVCEHGCSTDDDEPCPEDGCPLSANPTAPDGGK